MKGFVDRVVMVTAFLVEEMDRSDPFFVCMSDQPLAQLSRFMKKMGCAVLDQLISRTKTPEYAQR